MHLALWFSLGVMPFLCLLNSKACIAIMPVSQYCSSPYTIPERENMAYILQKYDMPFLRDCGFRHRKESFQVFQTSTPHLKIFRSSLFLRSQEKTFFKVNVLNSEIRRTKNRNENFQHQFKIDKRPVRLTATSFGYGYSKLHRLPPK